MYEVTIHDLDKYLQGKKSALETIVLDIDPKQRDRSQAYDLAIARSEEMYPDHKRYVEIRELHD
jgi:hypothetical protein